MHLRPANQFLKWISSDQTIPYVGFLWGLAEGIFFFIVPDVFILFVTSFSIRKGLRAWVYSIIGSLVSVMVLWGLTLMYSPTDLLNLLAKTPGITPELNAGIFEILSAHGLPFTPLLVLGGVPLKVYTLNAFALIYPLFFVLGWAIFARIVRIGPGFLLMGLINQYLGRQIESHQKRWVVIYVGFWIAFYIYYFKKMGI